MIAMDVEHAPLARAVAEAAYEAGARYVSVLYWDQHVKLARLRHAPGDSLGFVPDWWERLASECRERRGAVISLWGDPEPGLLADIEPARMAADQMPLTGSMFELFGSGEANWTVVPAPTRDMARRLLGTDEVERLWDVLAPLLRLDAADPESAWREHVARLRGRTRQLEERVFTALHFSGPVPISRFRSFRAPAGSPAASRRPGVARPSRTCRPKRCSRRPTSEASKARSR